MDDNMMHLSEDPKPSRSNSYSYFMLLALTAFIMGLITSTGGAVSSFVYESQPSPVPEYKTSVEEVGMGSVGLKDSEVLPSNGNVISLFSSSLNESIPSTAPEYKKLEEKVKELEEQIAMKESDSPANVGVSVTEISPTQPQCLSSDRADNLLASFSQVFIVMPSKAAGTTVNELVLQCMRTIGIEYTNGEKRDTAAYLTGGYKRPPMLSTHLNKKDGNEQLLKYIQHATKDSLIIYVHREETSRLFSSIKHFTENRLCNPKPPDGREWLVPEGFVDVAEISSDRKKCVVNESDLMRGIRNGVTEIGGSGYKYLTCGNYDAIEEFAPNFWFVNYRKVDDLQRNLAQRFCPKLVDKLPVRMNDSSDRTMKAHIRLVKGNGKKEVTLDEWVEAKRPLLEWTLNAKSKVTCQAKTRRIESTIDACDDGIVQVSSATEFYIP